MIGMQKEMSETLRKSVLRKLIVKDGLRTLPVVLIYNREILERLEIEDRKERYERQQQTQREAISSLLQGPSLKTAVEEEPPAVLGGEEASTENLKHSFAIVTQVSSSLDCPTIISNRWEVIFLPSRMPPSNRPSKLHTGNRKPAGVFPKSPSPLPKPPHSK